MASNLQIVKDALRANVDRLIDRVAADMVWLNAKEEWDSDDNCNTAEGIALFAQEIGLPAANAAEPDGFTFYREAGRELGWGPDDLGYDEEVE